MKSLSRVESADMVAGAGLLALVGAVSFGYFWYARPAWRLRADLERYRARGCFEPIDDDPARERMHQLVLAIKARRIYRASGVLVDVWLYYDATDNYASGAAREALLGFGLRSLPAVRAKILELASDNHTSIADYAKSLERDILARAMQPRSGE